MDHGNASSRTLLASLVSHCCMSRRLEDRIRELCSLAVAASTPVEMDLILPELSAALRKHIERFRSLAGNRHFPLERRHQLLP